MTDQHDTTTLRQIVQDDQMRAQNTAILNVSNLVAVHYRNLTSKTVGMTPDHAAELCSEMQGQLLMVVVHPEVGPFVGHRLP